MQQLFHFAQMQPHLTPSEALDQFVETVQTQGHAMAMAHGNPNQVFQQPPGQRTPGINGPQYSSPAAGHLGPPGTHPSPHVGNAGHTPSPAQHHLAGPTGMAGPSQGQTGPGVAANQAASSNASPSISNKRRRASAVKVEADEGGGPETNGVGPAGNAKVKASPRVGGKRQKAS